MTRAHETDIVDLQDLRVKLYDLLGHSYSSISPSPGALILLQSVGMMGSQTDGFDCQGRVRGTGFLGKRFSVQEVRAAVTDITKPGFEGLIVSLSHTLSLHGRTVILPNQGAQNPLHIDGMKRAGPPSRSPDAGFEVYADDQTQGQALISADFLEGLQRLKALTPSEQASAAFTGRQMHVVLPTAARMRFSEFVTFQSHDEAAAQIADEITRVVTLIAQVDELQSKANRKRTAEADHARTDYYLSATHAIEPMVKAAMKAGLVDDARRAKHLTREAFRMTLASPELLAS